MLSKHCLHLKSDVWQRCNLRECKRNSSKTKEKIWNLPWHIEAKSFYLQHKSTHKTHYQKNFSTLLFPNKIYRFRNETNARQHVILHCNNLIIYVTKHHTRLLCGRCVIGCVHISSSSKQLFNDKDNNRMPKEKQTPFNWRLVWKERYVIWFNWAFDVHF